MLGVPIILRVLAMTPMTVWAMRNKVQDLIKAKEIEFDAPENPNVITAPMPKHGRGVNFVDKIGRASCRERV